MKILSIISISIVVLYMSSCKKDSIPELAPEYVCWTNDYTVSTDTSIYYDGIFRFRIGNNWTYKRTNLQLDSNNVDTVTYKISQIRTINSSGKQYWIGYFGWLRTSGMDIFTTEYCYSDPSCNGCPTERPFFKYNLPFSFSLNWHHNSPSYSYTYKTDTIITPCGTYPNYYKIVLAGPNYAYWYIVENVGVVKYEWNPGYSFTYELISYDIH